MKNIETFFDELKSLRLSPEEKVSMRTALLQYVENYRPEPIISYVISQPE
jgi:hypothetical protein